MDFLDGGDFHAVDAEDAFAAAGLGKGGRVVGGMVVGEGDDVEPPLAGEAGQGGRGQVERPAGGQAGVVLEVAVEQHGGGSIPFQPRQLKMKWRDGSLRGRGAVG